MQEYAFWQPIIQAQPPLLNVHGQSHTSFVQKAGLHRKLCPALPHQRPVTSHWLGCPTHIRNPGDPLAASTLLTSAACPSIWASSSGCQWLAKNQS